MLSRVAEQLERGLAFDHVGIGLLDYASKEVIIQAEAGRRRGALGRRLPLGESIVGRVARTGQTCVERNLSGAEMSGTVLPGSASVLALPVFYADQLHGVLYVETAEPTDFSDEDVRLLHTLADLISVALHNALTLQKAQEQAITDRASRGLVSYSCPRTLKVGNSGYGPAMTSGMLEFGDWSFFASSVKKI